MVFFLFNQIIALCIRSRPMATTSNMSKEIVNLIAQYLPYGETLDGECCDCGGCARDQDNETTKQAEIAENVFCDDQLASEIWDDYLL